LNTITEIEIDKERYEREYSDMRTILTVTIWAFCRRTLLSRFQHELKQMQHTGIGLLPTVHTAAKVWAQTV